MTTSNPYAPRFSAFCVTPECGWFAEFFDRHVADGAARTHGMLKPGHEATVERIEK